MSQHPAPDSPAARPAVSLPRLREMQGRGEKIAVITCYDASFARLVDAAGVDVILVGDSLGMALQGHASTVPVSLDDVAYHTACVARARVAPWLVADMPLGTYEESREHALRCALALLRAGAQMVKLEGGDWTPEVVDFLVRRGVPVCAHLGLTPQRVNALGGYRIQGRTPEAAAALRADARALADAGAAMMVLELVPSAVAAQVTADNPGLMTIGIGAGGQTSGQVLVLHDMLGVTRGRLPRFVRDFMADGGSIESAVARYVGAVKDGSFPVEGEHTY